MKTLLEYYVDGFDYSGLLITRPSQTTRRSCILAQARDLLVKNHLLPREAAKLASIQHYPSGEPYLVFPQEVEEKGLRISISHSGLWCACLISHAEQPAAIDLEDLHIKRDIPGIVRNYFSGPEREYIERNGVERNGREAFYELWTAKEAIAKLNGKGLSEALKINLYPSSSGISFDGCNDEGCNYRLIQHIAQDFIYTIASKGCKKHQN